MDFESLEEYTGNNPMPVYVGEKYKNKLMPNATIVKNPRYNTTMFFTEHECREILRQLTGFRGYKQMQVYSYMSDELLYYNTRVTKVLYKKIANKVAGIILQMECDSQFAWSKEFEAVYDVKAGECITLYNTSDDLNSYLLPKVMIIPKSTIERLEIINLSDKNWTTTIKNIGRNETITMDSHYGILLSSNNKRTFADDFNMHFIRLVAGENKIQINSDITIDFKFRLPRKVGFV